MCKMCSRQVRGFERFVRRFEESGLVQSLRICCIKHGRFAIAFPNKHNDGWFVVGGIRVNDASGHSRCRHRRLT